MDSEIENLNRRLRALILKERHSYAVDTLSTIENMLLDTVLPIHEVESYMENARKIVFKK